MATKTLEIIDYSKIQSFSIKVTEAIQDKYLLDFLRTSLENQTVDLSKNGKFYYTFIPTSLTYEILYCEDCNNQSILEPFVFLSKCGTATKELFITKNYFCLFDSQQLVLYKDIKNILQEDIQTYIEQLYKIKIDKVTLVDTDEYESIKNKFVSNNQKFSWKLYSVKKENSYQIFLIYTAITFFIFISCIYLLFNSTNPIVLKEDTTAMYEKGYKKLLLVYKAIDKRPIQTSIELMKYLDDKKIVIEKLSYKNSKLYFILLESNRKKLLDVIGNYKQKMEIQSMLYDEKLKKYKTELVLHVKK